jgi:hypothetical protein
MVEKNGMPGVLLVSIAYCFGHSNDWKPGVNIHQLCMASWYCNGKFGIWCTRRSKEFPDLCMDADKKRAPEGALF